MICSNCGNEIKDGQRFCTNCGAAADMPVDGINPAAAKQDMETTQSTATTQSVETVQSAKTSQMGGMTQTAGTTQSGNSAAGAAYSTQKSAEAIVASLPREYKPLSIWQFFGFEVLFSIPIVGVIVSLIFALDASKNVCLTNFARARFLWIVLETILTMFAVVMVAINFLH